MDVLLYANKTAAIDAARGSDAPWIDREAFIKAVEAVDPPEQSGHINCTGHWILQVEIQAPFDRTSQNSATKTAGGFEISWRWVTDAVTAHRSRMESQAAYRSGIDAGLWQ